MLATAIYVGTESGDGYLFLENQAFTVESLISYLKNSLEEEYPWVSSIELEGLNWNTKELNTNEVFDDIYKELDKIY